MNPAVARAKLGPARAAALIRRQHLRQVSDWLVSCALSCAVLACQNTSSEGQAAAVEVSKEAATPAAAQRLPALPTAPAPSPEAVPSGAAPSSEASGEAAKAAPAGALNAPVAAASGNTAGGSIAAPRAKPGAASPSAAAPLAETPPATETKKGTVVSEEPFSTWLEASSPLATGSATGFDVVLMAKPPYHTNAEYPHKFKLNAAPPGLSYPEAVVKGMQVKPERSVLHVPVQAQHAGPATVSGTLSFSVCTEERCLVEKRDLSLALEVK